MCLFSFNYLACVSSCAQPVISLPMFAISMGLNAIWSTPVKLSDRCSVFNYLTYVLSCAQPNISCQCLQSVWNWMRFDPQQLKPLYRFLHFSIGLRFGWILLEFVFLCWFATLTLLIELPSIGEFIQHPRWLWRWLGMSRKYIRKPFVYSLILTYLFMIEDKKLKNIRAKEPLSIHMFWQLVVIGCDCTNQTM